MSNELKLQWKAFADYYIETGNKTKSYKKAYPGCKSDKSADASVRKLLGNTRIKEYIAERIKPTEEKRIATGDEVMEFFTKTMRGEIKDSFGLEASLQDRMNAAKELAKRLVDISGGNEEYESDGFMEELKGNVADTFKNAEGNIDE